MGCSNEKTRRILHPTSGHINIWMLGVYKINRHQNVFPTTSQNAIKLPANSIRSYKNIFGFVPDFTLGINGDGGFLYEKKT